ncbi:MAG: hypothetical protein ACOH15_04980 [Acetobacterium sp.]
MYKLCHLQETSACHSFSLLPLAIQKMVNDVLVILDDCYGINRDVMKDLGGYVMVLESQEDMDALKDNMKVNLEAETFEYVMEASKYLGCLLLLGSDYHLYLVLPKSLAPLHVLNQIEG